MTSRRTGSRAFRAAVFAPFAFIIGAGLVAGLLAGVIAGCESPYDRHVAGDPPVTPPEWARSAIWYQIFVERFDNGDPTNDPGLDDIAGSWPHEQPAGWQVKPWTSDWYGRAPWEQAVSDDFYYSVQLRRYGGDLQGVIDRLDHIQSLGVNALYLNPINDAPSLHKFDARNYRHVDRNFGPNPLRDAAIMASEVPHNPRTWKWTSADSLFLELIAEVHRRDMRIIVDYSWNHTGMTFWAFRDIVENQASSIYADWYRINKFDDPATPENEFDYVGWAGVRELPELAKLIPDNNYDRRPLNGDMHEGAKGLAFAVSRRWLDPNGDGDPSDGVDGFRLDVAEMIPLQFWRLYRRHVKSINPEAYLVGEIWWEDWPDRMLNPTPWIGDVFDAVMNYRWYMPTRSFVTGATPRVTASQYAAHLDSIEAGLPRDNVLSMMNVAASHDTPRLVTSLQNKGRYKHSVVFRDNPDFEFSKPDAATRALQKVLLTQQYTFYGAPHIWAGDELGMWGGDDPDNRKPLWWPELSFESETVPGGSGSVPVGFDPAVLEFYRRLGAMRLEYAEVLVSGSCTTLFEDDARRAVVYERRLGDTRLVVVLNAGDATLDLRMSDFGLSDAKIVLASETPGRSGPVMIVPARSAIVAAELP